MIESLPAGLVDAIPDGLIVADGSGTVRYANQRIEELSGYDRSELIGRSVEMLVPPASRRAHLQNRAAYAAAGHPIRGMGVEVDTRLLRKDGKTLAVDIALSPLEEGENSQVVATIRDATARREVEADRGELQRRFGELVENVDMLVVGLDREGRVFYVNPHFSEVTGYDREDVIGADWFARITDDDDVEEVRSVFREVLASDHGHAYHENRITSRRGRHPTIGWFNIRLLDPDGEVTGSLSIGEDLTARRLAEERLRAVNRVRQAILTTDVEPEAVFTVIAREAEALAEADLAVLVVPTEGGYLARAASGQGADRLVGARLGAPPWQDVFALRHPTAFPSAAPLLPEAGEDLGPALVVPPANVDAQGVLCVARRPGRGGFDDDDIATLEQLAGLATVAVEYRQTQQSLREMAVFEDRERIARDMHDVVIQRLFAAGLAIQIAIQELEDARAVRERLRRVVESLDETIKELRSRIFSLHSHHRAGLYDRVLHVVEELTPTLRFAPEVEVTASSDDIPEYALEHLLATLREALTNVARHAGADHATVEVRAGEDLTLIVEDDGKGLPSDLVRGRGLDNMAERARRLGGDFSLREGRAGGVRLEWQVPFSAQD